MAGDRTHYEGCWRVHHECAVAEVERLRTANLEAGRLVARTERLEAIVRELAEEDDVELHPVTGRVRCRRCRRGAVGGYIDHRPDCPWLRARQEVARG